LESTVQRMLIPDNRVIDYPALEFVDDEELEKATKEEHEKMANRELSMRQPVKYRTRAQTQQEQEELALAAEFDEIRDVQNLTKLMRENRLKEFYQLANKVLRIKRSHPVVTRVTRIDNRGEIEVIDDKSAAEQAIAEYFTNIYKRPDHMMPSAGDIDFNVDTDEEMKGEDDQLDELPLFSTEEVDNAAKSSNFNKGLGPDCFDGNMLKDNKELGSKVIFEITDALNSA